MATHSSIVAWRILWTEEPGRLQSMGLQELDTTQQLNHHHDQLYGNKMDNLEEMDRFLEEFNLPRLNQEEIEIMKNPITSTEIEAMIKDLPENIHP